ncbi:helix-turn-helix domain-containing protein [Muricoccus nepalensis]|uniref:helix-turn-helix domain-containing protein n=1 Tax=Muricoccus nepalensis TaxID=1854500 RepID=UPI0038D0E0DC
MNQVGRSRRRPCHRHRPHERLSSRRSWADAYGESTVTEVAARLNMPEGSLYTWIYKGRLGARRVEVGDRPVYLVRLDDVQHLFRQRGPGGCLPPRTSS